MPADQAIVDRHIDGNGNAGGNQRQTNALHRTQRNAENLRNDQKRHRNGVHAKVRRGKGDHLRVIGKNAGKRGRKQRQRHGVKQAETERHRKDKAKTAQQVVFLFCPPVLRKQGRTTRSKAEANHVQQKTESGGNPDGGSGGVTQPHDHHRIHQRAAGGQQVLKRDRQGKFEGGAIKARAAGIGFEKFIRHK